MTIFGWNCREPAEHSSPGGHCSTKWHPSKSFHTSWCGGLDGRLALSGSVSSSTEINKKAPSDTRKVTREKYALWKRQEGAVLAWAWSPEGMGLISVERCLHWGVCPEAGCLHQQRCLPSLRSPSPSGQVSSSCSTGASALSSPQAPACSCAWTLTSWVVAPDFCFLAPTVHYLLPLAEDAAISSHLLLIRNDAGENPIPADVLQKAFMAPLFSIGKSSLRLIWTAGWQECITTKVEDFYLIFRNNTTVIWGKNTAKSERAV